MSDTHGYWDERYLNYFEPCDEIWHAGDIGSPDIAERLQAFRPLRAVYGNIDGQDLRLRFPEIQRFTIEGADVLMKPIGGILRFINGICFTKNSRITCRQKLNQIQCKFYTLD